MQKFKKDQKVVISLNGKNIDGYIEFYNHGFYRICTYESYVSGEVNILGIGGDIIEPVAHWIPEKDISLRDF